MKIYLAGKFERDESNETRSDWRCRLGLNDPVSGERSVRSVAALRHAVVPLKGLPFTAVGPFFQGLDGHESTSHDLADSYPTLGATQADVSSLVRSWIERCEIFFAWLDADADAAYGTILEIGYASALRKQIVIGLGSGFPERFARCGSYDETDQWLALSFADVVLRASTPEGALRQLANPRFNPGVEEVIDSVRAARARRQIAR